MKGSFNNILKYTNMVWPHYL